MGLFDMIAKEVVVEPKPNYRFDVDGEPFPWYISERGPILSRIADDLYVVDVQIIHFSKENKDFLDFRYETAEWEAAGTAPYVPVIGGEPFPWLCTGDEMVLRFSHKQVPTLELKFFARSVNAKSLYIDDKRDIFCAGGHLIHSYVQVDA